MKKPLIAASALIIPILVATAQDTDKSKWKDVGIEFPKPMFVGTPVAAKLPNLDKSKKPRLVLKAPAEFVVKPPLGVNEPLWQSKPLRRRPKNLFDQGVVIFLDIFVKPPQGFSIKGRSLNVQSHFDR